MTELMKTLFKADNIKVTSKFVEVLMDRRNELIYSV